MPLGEHVELLGVGRSRLPFGEAPLAPSGVWLPSGRPRGIFEVGRSRLPVGEVPLAPKGELVALG